MVLRNSNTGAFQVYDISNNAIVSSSSLGTVGLNWQFAGIAPVHAAGASDLALRDVNTGAVKLITRSNFLGAVPASARAPNFLDAGLTNSD
jgi:hypothetical protein